MENVFNCLPFISTALPELSGPHENLPAEFRLIVLPS